MEVEGRWRDRRNADGLGDIDAVMAATDLIDGAYAAPVVA